MAAHKVDQMARGVTPSQLRSMLHLIRTKTAQAVDESDAVTFLWSIIPGGTVIFGGRRRGEHVKNPIVPFPCVALLEHERYRTLRNK